MPFQTLCLGVEGQLVPADEGRDVAIACSFIMLYLPLYPSPTRVSRMRTGFALHPQNKGKKKCL